MENSKHVDYKELVKQGAIILDVRSHAEFEDGHIKGAINVPVELLSSSLSKFSDKNKPIITYCVSGLRSSMACNFLKGSGYANVHNGGVLESLQRLLQ